MPREPPAARGDRAKSLHPREDIAARRNPARRAARPGGVLTQAGQPVYCAPLPPEVLEMPHSAVVKWSTSPQQDGRRVRSDKRALILDAAIRVFARMGYHGARISDIAGDAGIAYGLVYHYFKNKEEILNTIFEERWSGFVDALEGIAGGPTSTEDKLASISALILNAYRLRPEWVKVFVLEIQRSSRFAEPGQIRAVGRLFQIVARVLRDGQAKGEIRGTLDPDVASYVFVGGLEIVITGLVLDLIRIDESGEPATEYYLKVARTVVEICLRGLAARGGER
jgi:AcrR family transcriptional regulator